VLVVDLDIEAAAATLRDLRGSRGVVTYLNSDVSNPSSASDAVRQVEEELGPLDLLVNCAGTTRDVSFLDLAETDWDHVFAVNTKGAFFYMQAAARVMVPRSQGCIINVASISGKGWTGTRNVAYASSKAALIAMTRVGASTLAQHDIRVNAICPGYTSTPLFRRLVEDRAEQTGVTPDEIIARIEAEIPLKRLNSALDVAEVAVFLAADASRNITGQSINVDGGLVWD